MHYVASVSFGKDSLAMLLLLLEKKYPLDEVVFYDTGKEFQAIYNLEQRVKPMVERLGIKYTRLEPEFSFDYKMFEKPVCRMGTNEIHKFGYSWCGGTCRWGTTDKLQHIKRYLAQYGEYKEYVGIAADESERLLKEREYTKVFPLADWGMVEQSCLQACYDRGYHWYENTSDGVVDLYNILDRVSCWCCRNKNLKELKGIYDFLPEYWEKLRDMQSKLKEPMKGNGKSIFDLEKWFEVGCKNKREYKKYLKSIKCDFGEEKGGYKMEKLEDIYTNKSLIYFCNTCGDINLPTDANPLTIHKPDELPLKERNLYENYWSEGDGCCMYVVQLHNETAMALGFLFDTGYCSDILSKSSDDVTEDDMKRFYQAIRDYSTLLEKDQNLSGCKVIVGCDTDPDGHEILVVIPYKMKNEIERIVSYLCEHVYSEVESLFV